MKEFDNKKYLNNSLKKARAVLRGMVAHAVSNDLDLQSDMILRQEQKILNIVKDLENGTYLHSFNDFLRLKTY